MRLVIAILVWVGLGYLLTSILGIQMGYIISAVVGTLVAVGLGSQKTENA